MFWNRWNVLTAILCITNVACILSKGKCWGQADWSYFTMKKIPLKVCLFCRQGQIEFSKSRWFFSLTTLSTLSCLIRQMAAHVPSRPGPHCHLCSRRIPWLSGSSATSKMALMVPPLITLLHDAIFLVLQRKVTEELGKKKLILMEEFWLIRDLLVSLPAKQKILVEHTIISSLNFSNVFSP